ncbi:MAG: EscU/YscU/HrcU family type III secretion system export apparatus switch protein [Planctomycetes bacterium]|nr:EscU/YscU/HrcU family type III secretion system export apparatus switch protein [Planctomycetota bacterium]
MAEAGGQERTEEATPQKRRKARERGQVAQSRDLTGTITLAAFVGALALRRDAWSTTVLEAFRHAFKLATAEGLDVARAGQTLKVIALPMLREFLPLTAIAALVGALASFVQTGALLSFEPITPKLEKLNPLEGLKRMFWSLKSWVEVARSLLKILVIGAVMYATFRSNAQILLGLHEQTVSRSVDIVAALAIDCVKHAILAFFLLGVIDLLYQRWQHGRDLRMTRQETKREHHDNEGQPEQKAARKRAHEEVLAQADMARVRQAADAVVVNPVHFACAISYDPDDGAPRLIAKARDHVAVRIRDLAEEAGIPVRHDVSLARALFELEIDDAVPVELYDAVAITLDWAREVLAQRGEKPHWERKDGATTPQQPR